MSALALLLAGTQAQQQVYVDDVFATYNYSGNGGANNIINGIAPDVVWMARKFTTSAPRAWADKALGSDQNAGLATNLTGGVNGYASSGLGLGGAFNSNGFSFGFSHDLNLSGVQYISWSFKKSAKFFDTRTWVGDGTSSSRTLTHNVGIKPGVIITKATSNAGGTEGTTQPADWWIAINTTADTWVRLKLNSTAAQFSTTTTAGDAPATNATDFNPYKVGFSGFTGGVSGNTNGMSYTGYLFAHDTAPTGIIRSGTFTTDASGNATISGNGWEPQWGLIKASSAAGDWIILDQVRGWSYDVNDNTLTANSNALESTATDYGYPTGDGFVFKGAASTTYVYMVIRRPNKPPTIGTQVFNSYLGSSSYDVGGIASNNGYVTTQDLFIMFGSRTTPTTPAWAWADRLRGYGYSGSSFLDSSSELAAAYRAVSPKINLVNNYIAFTPSTGNLVHCFARKSNVFDTVMWKGDGTAVARRFVHNLNSKPKLHIYKALGTPTNSQFRDWFVGGEALDIAFLGSETGGALARINTGAAAFNNIDYFGGVADASTISVGQFLNESGMDFVGYLFGDAPGISKVWWYNGTGANQTINCGFSTGARLVWIRRIDVAGDWLVFDTARGINSAANDPYLKLNTSGAEVTTAEKLIPHASGFQVNDNSSDINASGGKYLFVAIA